MHRRRVIAWVAILAVVTIARPPSANAQADTLLETLELSAGSPLAPSIPSATVLQGGTMYKLVATGTVTETFDDKGARFDACYCYEELIDGVPDPDSAACSHQSPQNRSNNLFVTLAGVPGLIPFQALDDPSFVLTTTLPYDDVGHRYEVTFTAPATGNLTARGFSTGSFSATASGKYILEIRQVGGDSCPAPESRVHTLATGQAPSITSVSVPPIAPAGALIPFTVGFSDPDGDVIVIIVTEVGGRVIGHVTLTPGPREGIITTATICENTPLLTTSHTVQFTIADRECSQATSGPYTYECVPKPLGPRIERGFNVLASTLATVFVAATKAPKAVVVGLIEPGLLKAIGVASGLAWMGNAAMSVYNADPPDPNFTVIAEPVIPPFPPVTAGAQVTPELAAAFNALYANQAQVIGVGRALVTSLERSQGAAAAGDVFWYSRQLEAAGRLSSQWARRFEAQPALAVDVQRTWRAAGLPETLTADDVLFVQDDVSSLGLPASLTEVFSELGMDGETVDHLTNALVAEDPAVLAGSFLEKLTDPEFTAALQDIAQSLDQFAAEVGPAGPCGSCDDGNACTDDACEPGSGCTHTPRPHLEGIMCALNAAARTPAACTQVPKGVTKQILKARNQVQKAIAKPKKARARLGKANQALSRAIRAIDKARRKDRLSFDCAEALLAPIRDAVGRIETERSP